MKRSLFEDGQAAQVAFWDIANSEYVAAAAAMATGFTADTVVFVSPTASDTWITVGTGSPSATAETDGNAFIPYGQIAVLAVNKDDKIATTQKISITPVK